MPTGYRWTAAWLDPATHLPTGVTREGYATAREARADALRLAPACAEVAIVAPDGTLVERIRGPRTKAP